MIRRLALAAAALVVSCVLTTPFSTASAQTNVTVNLESIPAGAQVFLEFAALALEFTVLIHQLALARHALALGHGGRFALELFAGSLEGVALVEQFFFALGEFGFQLGLGCLGSIGFTEDAIRVHKTSLELLGLCCSTKRQGSSQHHQRKGTRKGFH